MKQSKNLIYIPEYEPDLEKMVTALQILLKYKSDTKGKEQHLSQHEMTESIKNKL